MYPLHATRALRAHAPLPAPFFRAKLAVSLSSLALAAFAPSAFARPQPVAVSGQATSITANGASLAGTVDANNSAAAAWFDYGLTNAPYSSKVDATPSTVTGTKAAPITARIAGLVCGTKYHWRAHAKSAAGENAGADGTFTTAACDTGAAATAPPVATTLGANAVSSSSATLGASVVAGSATASASFEWGTTTAYGSSVSTSPATLAASSTAVAVSASVAGLACGTTYQYRVKASSAAGTAAGANASFATAACATTSSGGSLRVSVAGFGHVTSDAGSLSCGSVPANATGSSSRCFAPSVSGNVTLTATPFSPAFVFAGWSGDAACVGSVCTIPAGGAQWVRAKFVPATSATNACSALGLVSDKANHPLNASYPKLVAGQSFVDPNFGTTIRKITDVQVDNAGGAFAVPAYSTISAFNADETYLVLYRDGTGHVLYDGKTYAFIRALSDLPTADVEQFYWDTTKPNILYGASGARLYKYDVNAPAGQRTTVLHDFSATCGTKILYGGSDPFFNSWDSRQFGLTCASGGAMFSYDAVTNTLGAISTTLPRADGYTSPQATPSGRKLVMPLSTYARVFDLNLVGGPQLDQTGGWEHASMGMLADGSDSYNAVNYDPGPNGTGDGTLVQFNLDATPNASNWILGRVIVGPATGYPYPPNETHIGATAFHRTGLLGVSIIGTGSGATLLDNELLLVDSDLATNPSNAVCRVGHHRSNATANYWAEPHVAISPSGTRMVFGSSWGNSSGTAAVNSYVVELPGYRP